MTTDHDVRTAERRRVSAMLGGDAAAMDPLLSDRLTFVHANGGADDKPALLAKMRGGAIVYHSIAWADQKVDARGAVAAMSGVMTLEVTVGGVDKTLHNRAILLWERDAAGEWKLFHFQSTPIIQPR
jgi:ketosteroid isomerase-like protein